ncbi:MAG: bifunctional oligoribonuclease/PAP phosphatase NrnA [Candidatus Saccharibacteria bacterium]|nr:bifunctional oligoribonuclease/PAP phosphatase NrnA [Candidatus Saccharibacteria bacterium]
MYNNFSDFLKDKGRICVIQAENPDGDSLGSALALEELLKDKEVSLFCPVNIPPYLRYFEGWGRVNDEFPTDVDGYIIVDTAADILLSKVLEDLAARDALENKPVFVIDHHETEDDLSFSHEAIIETLPSCTNLIYKIAKDQNIEVSKLAAELLLQGLTSDTLGFTVSGVDADTFRTAAELLEYGADIAELDEKRREFMKKSQRILGYKADLIKRIEYHLDGNLATVHIPWEDIEEYSNEYNPGVLILDEMRMVEGVKIAVAIKTYPDGRVTGKLRSSVPISEEVAGYFGGGGHPYAAGFRTYDTDYNGVVKDLIKCVYPLLELDD